MEKWDDSCVDLIYLDPPFNSKVDYNIIYGKNGAGDAQYRAFSDIWHWDDEAAKRFEMFEGAVSRPAHDVIVGLHRLLGECGMSAYLTYMAERLEQMHRILKLTGSIYLHCDPTMSHYLKLLLDSIFEPKRFQNEIVWQRTLAHNMKTNRFGRVNDILLFYSRSADYFFNQVYMPYSEAQLKRYREDEDGRAYKAENLTFSTANPSRQFEWRGSKPPPHRSWGASREQLEEWYDEGRILLKKDGTPRLDGLKVYLDETLGKAATSNWTDIPRIGNTSAERLGYPTQKPIALLDRIIKASSNRGDLVLDPFCGCGTAIDAAQRLGRNWAGIDISSFAIDLIRDKRLKRIGVMAATRGIPYDLVSARKLSIESPFNFESWAIARIPGFAPNTKQIADGGIDGRATLATKPDNFDSARALAQTKGGRFNLSNFRDFCHVIDREKAALGCFITVDEVSSPAARKEAAGCGRISVSGYSYNRMNLWPISDYFGDRGLPRLPIMNDPFTGKAMRQADLFALI